LARVIAAEKPIAEKNWVLGPKEYERRVNFNGRSHGDGLGMFSKKGEKIKKNNGKNEGRSVDCRKNRRNIEN